MYSKILIAFDGNNLNVIRALARVSRTPDAKVFLITVVKMTLIEKIGRPLFSLINKDWRPATYAGQEKSATTTAQDLAAFSEKVATYIRIGDPYLEIKKLIKEVQPDLIIMGGSLPTNELSRFTAPTVGVKIAAIVKVSVLLAK